MDARRSRAATATSSVRWCAPSSRRVVGAQQRVRIARPAPAGSVDQLLLVEPLVDRIRRAAARRRTSAARAAARAATRRGTGSRAAAASGTARPSCRRSSASGGPPPLRRICTSSQAASSKPGYAQPCRHPARVVHLDEADAPIGARRVAVPGRTLAAAPLLVGHGSRSPRAPQRTRPSQYSAAVAEDRLPLARARSGTRRCRRRRRAPAADRRSRPAAAAAAMSCVSVRW